MDLYNIVRYHREKSKRIKATGLTLEEARAYCQREDSHKIDNAGNVVWYDGYTKE